MTRRQTSAFRPTPLVFAVATMLLVVVMGLTQVLPTSPSRSDPTGVSLAMVAAVIFVLTLATVTFVGWLSSDERGESFSVGLGPLLLAVPAIVLVLVLAITQVIANPALRLDPLGVAMTMVALVLVFLTVVTISFVNWLSADERGAFD